MNNSQHIASQNLISANPGATRSAFAVLAVTVVVLINVSIVLSLIIIS